MLRWIALAALLFACAPETTRYVAPEGQDDGWLRDTAEGAWGQVGVETPADYTILFLGLGDLQDACEDGNPGLAGCTDPVARAVLINVDNDPSLQARTIVHEVGHLIRGDKRLGHLDCPESEGGKLPGASVMCATGAPVGTMPTARDAAFVRAR